MPQTYRLIASNTRKEVVWRKGMTLEAAERLKHAMNWDSRYCFLLTRIEAEDACPCGSPTCGGMCPENVLDEEQPATEPAPAPVAETPKPRRTFDALAQEERVTRARQQAGDYSQAQRFWSKIDRRGENECWEWQTGRGRDGYGVFHRDRRHIRAHREAWELTHGPIPAGLLVCHTCDNPPCCNPAHLFLGTSSDNALDREAKDRGKQPSGDDHYSRTQPGRILRGERVGTSKLCNAQVPYIRAMLANGLTQEDIARAYGVNQRTISRIARGERWAG